MIGPMHLSVNTDGLNCPTLSHFAGLPPVPASRIEGFGTSHKTIGRLRHAGSVLERFLWAPDLRWKHLIASCAVLDLGCSSLRQIRFSGFSQEPSLFCRLKRV